jgi:small ligand-binding sensory domain FIST
MADPSENRPLPDDLRFASAISELIDPDAAVADCVEQLQRQLAGRPPHVLFLFVSPHHRDAFSFIQESLLADLKPAHLLGCSGGGVIGAARELEETPALAVTAASLPGVGLTLRHLQDDDLPGLDEPPRAWERALGVTGADEPQFVLLASPFMDRAEDLLLGLDYAFPRSPKVGGVASGLRHVSERALFLDGQRFSNGVLVLALTGPIRLHPLVAQGCRPVGPVLTISAADRNVIEGLDGRPAAEALHQVYDAADARTKDLLQRALFVGLLTDPLAAGEPKAGDFLMRNVMGIDGREGSIALAAFVREGMRVQFHVRDGEAADQDLRKVLDREREARPELKPAGALLFSCMGRGERLFGEPDHDSQAFVQAFGTSALGGFFGNGEIGPVGASTHLHGFTSCFALFSRP